MPPLSVIIPLFNKGPYIARTLRSVVAQTYRDFEVLVVDDGSSDEGPDIVERLADNRVRLFHQSNAGPGAARNRGFRESRGELVAFLDADDEWLPQFLEESLARLRAHPHCALSVSGFYQGARRTNRSDLMRARGITPGPWRLPTDATPLATHYAVDFLSSCSIVARREAVARFGGYYERDCCAYGEDNYLWLQILLNMPVYRDPAPLLWFHSEASDLGYLGRSTPFPLPPALTDPEPIRAACPASYRATLERYLSLLALLTARRQCYGGNRAAARWAVQHYPCMRTLGHDYRRLWLEMHFPPVRWAAKVGIAALRWKARRREEGAT